MEKHSQEYSKMDKKLQANTSYQMEAIIKDNIKMEYPMEGESLDGPMELDI
jgi:hypothetical protein